ncbi:DUF550 domain-containing protein [Escherichia coli]|nr:DUF550 domain-containing protein [Escherichia coli]
MTTITREQALKIIEAADEVISALAGTNEDVHPGSDNMLRLWDDLNDRYAPPEVVRELARIALASLEREQIRHEHAKWSDSTFGCVGPIGPLKHLSKEALEAAAEPDDLSEWADMQFLLWDAQRRAGISDAEITAAMENKLKINMERQWPEPKDGEPRLHIKEPGNSPVTPDGWISCSERMPVIGELNWRTSFPLLVTCEIGVIPAYYGFVSVNGDRHYGFMESLKYGDDNGNHPQTNEYGLISNVTHWMPLPEPPQEVK